eukprot:1211985-Rhodomonas_salina.2
MRLCPQQQQQHVMYIKVKTFNWTQRDASSSVVQARVHTLHFDRLLVVFSIPSSLPPPRYPASRSISLHFIHHSLPLLIPSHPYSFLAPEPNSHLDSSLPLPPPLPPFTPTQGRGQAREVGEGERGGGAGIGSERESEKEEPRGQTGGTRAAQTRRERDELGRRRD